MNRQVIEQCLEINILLPGNFLGTPFKFSTSIFRINIVKKTISNRRDE